MFMPELPEVEIVKRALETAMDGQKFEKIVFNRPDLRFPLPKDLPETLAGQGVQSVFRRGKYVLVFARNGQGFVLHLGMSGVIRIEDSPKSYSEEKHDHVALYLRGGRRVVLNDARRFGFIEALQEKTWRHYPAFASMGAEPLGNDFNGPALAAALKGRKTAIKIALLDQRIVAGIGNIYACEALFDAGINPLEPAGKLSLEVCETLAGCIKKVLLKAIDAGGSSLKDYKHTDGKLGYFQHQFAVYDRQGKPCPACKCDILQTGGVQRIVQSGRSTFYCKTRQA